MTITEEFIREAFTDGWLRGFNAARQLLAINGGTLEAPTRGCINESAGAFKRAKERFRKRRYPKLRAVKVIP